MVSRIGIDKNFLLELKCCYRILYNNRIITIDRWIYCDVRWRLSMFPLGMWLSICWFVTRLILWFKYWIWRQNTYSNLNVLLCNFQKHCLLNFLLSTHFGNRSRGGYFSKRFGSRMQTLHINRSSILNIFAFEDFFLHANCRSVTYAPTSLKLQIPLLNIFFLVIHNNMSTVQLGVCLQITYVH